jgi:hypothetical protein
VGVRRCLPRAALTVVKTVVRRVPANGRSVAELWSIDGESATRSNVASPQSCEETMSPVSPLIRRSDRDCCQDKS